MAAFFPQLLPRTHCLQLSLCFFMLCVIWTSWKQHDSHDPHESEVMELHRRTEARQEIPTPNSLEDSRLLCRNLRFEKKAQRCLVAKTHCEGSSKSLVNYLSLHFCSFSERTWISVPFLVTAVITAFYFLARTAEQHFSVVVRRLSAMLGVSPSMGAVTLLALGNGAPDVLASIAAVRAGNERIGVGAIVSAGTFVTAVVVGFVALAASPFSVNPLSFVRDVCFYITAVILLFLIYASGEIYLWQASGLVIFYVLFVMVVLFMDHMPVTTRSAIIEDAEGVSARLKTGRTESIQEGDIESNAHVAITPLRNGQGEGLHKWIQNVLQSFSSLIWCFEKDCQVCMILSKISCVWQLPVEVILRSTIPAVDISNWNRYYAAANFVFCPLVLLYLLSSIVSPHHRVISLVLAVDFPLWSVILFESSFLGVIYFVYASEPPQKEQPLAIGMAFFLSVFWISFIAGELLGCLAALGLILNLPPALLGLTVLAWGNSIGDLVTDVAVARAGQPVMAIAGCFTGPMFNMLVGLGLALSMRTVSLHPSPYPLEYHPSIIVAFSFLLTSLFGSLLVVTGSKFKVPRYWGFCLIGLYTSFIAVSMYFANIF